MKKEIEFRFWGFFSLKINKKNALTFRDPGEHLSGRRLSSKKEERERRREEFVLI